MSHDEKVECGPHVYKNTKQQIKSERIHAINRARRKIFEFLHGCFWGFMFAIRLGWAYSRLLCRLGLYKKFHDGRCMYCGLIK